MKNRLDLRNYRAGEISPLGGDFSGTARDGRTLSVNSSFLELDGRPFFGIAGEFHYSRMHEARWESELIKMRLGGINIVSTYLFWNHIEEEEGVFDFTGQHNLRAFLQLCAKHGLYVILRIGPFDHGEVRNGGLPDWLYGKPFEVRHTNEGFLRYVRRLYTKIGEQTEGLYFRDGGPIIGVQLDNEYMHSSAAWEFTTGISDEWIFVGSEGEKYMLTLKDLAASCGISPVFYTSTAWGGAPVSRSILPLWGGYAYRPWIFYSHRGEHPATEEYIYEDYHHRGKRYADDFQPSYDPESFPYACCEMGAGMMCCYYYRFVYPYRSVDALSNIKLASGCNFIGYYMFQGGTNPLGKHGQYMNESQVPKRSYDYQAALGEFGQVRESYSRLKSIHSFCTSFAETLLPMETVLPEGASEISPEDLDTLRYAVRTDGKSGFLFINNFQDHREMPAKKGLTVTLDLPDETIDFPVDLAGDENCILPFNFSLDGILLKNAAAQPVLRTEISGRPVYVFLVPDGMTPVFTFEEGTTVRTAGREEGPVCCPVPEDGHAFLTACRDGRETDILLLSRQLADQLFLLRDGSLLLTEAALLEDETGRLSIETTAGDNRLLCFPAERLRGTAAQFEETKDGIGYYRLRTRTKEIPVTVGEAANRRYILSLPADALEGCRDVRLTIRYSGDIGSLFLNDVLVSDNFANGAPWEVGLLEHADSLDKPFVLYITPLREGANVNVESAMAARHEDFDASIAELHSVEAVPVYEVVL